MRELHWTVLPGWEPPYKCYSDRKPIDFLGEIGYAYLSFIRLAEIYESLLMGSMNEFEMPTAWATTLFGCSGGLL